MAMMLNDRALPAVAFVCRCSLSATLAYLAAGWVGLPHPIWATMSALIVSQEKLDATRASLKWRILGTLIGIGIGLAVSLIASPLGLTLAAQIALSVAISAVIAHYDPDLRVCMWTGPIVLLTGSPSEPIAMVALYRGSEVMMGALVGGALHAVSALAVARVSGARGG